jgi:hypothetical protein
MVHADEYDIHKDNSSPLFSSPGGRRKWRRGNIPFSSIYDPLTSDPLPPGQRKTEECVLTR